MPTLEFKGKQHIYAHHLTVPYSPLVPDPQKSHPSSAQASDVDLVPDDNLIIHGDNLRALKALLPRYAGKVNCIYIDPPYNTGNEGWTYNDNVNTLMTQTWLQDNSPVDNEDLERHDKWLCVIWPRLQLLRDLLADDGVIFVSIDDNEQHHLRMIMDEVFGDSNYVASFVWEGTAKNDARFVSVGHDYVLAYAKSFEQVKTNTKRWRVLKEGIDDIQECVERLKKEHGEDYRSISSGLKDWYRSLPRNHKAWQHRHYNWVDAHGVYFPGDISWPGGGGPRYEVLHPITRKPVTVPARGWVFPREETMDDAIRANRVHFGDTESGVPNLKRYLHETNEQVLTSVFYQDRRAAHQNVRRILGNVEFEYPKDERVIGRLIETVTSNGDVILDSFAGSGTTAHATLALNKEDGGGRRFILVECEDYADTITAERVRRVIDGVPDVKDDTLREGLGGSFTYCTLGEPFDAESLLKGDSLPDYETLAVFLLHTASGISLETEALRTARNDQRFYQTDTTDFYLYYQPDIEWLKSDEAMLTPERAKQIEASARPATVFGAGKYLSQRELTDMGITFCQLPYELFKGG